MNHQLLGASRTLGAGRARTFFRLALPLARPGLTAGAALAWARALGEFGATILFAGSLQGRTQTLPLAIYDQFSGGNLDGALAISALLVVVSAGILVGVNVLLRSRSPKGVAAWDRTWRSSSATT
jgi:molybdate transport system permease protein